MMNSYFVVALALMTITAIAFLMQPLWRRIEIRDSKSRTPYFAMALLVPVMTIVLYASLGDPQHAVAGTTLSRSATMTPPATGGSQAQQRNIDSVANLVRKELSPPRYENL